MSLVSSRRMPRRLVIALSIATALTAGPAFAQDATTNAPKAKTATLETVTVTAEKRTEDLQKVPISMTVITAEKLEAFGQAGDGVLQLAARAPSVYAETSYGREFPRFYIRGLGNSDFDLNASQPVSMVYDDIVQENPILKGFPLFDLEQVEVLRGPQGTLFGRNSPAGVIKFESRKPTQETEGYARVSYGSYGTANAEAALGGAGQRGMGGTGRQRGAGVPSIQQRHQESGDERVPRPQRIHHLPGLDGLRPDHAIPPGQGPGGAARHHHQPWPGCGMRVQQIMAGGI